MSHPVYPLCEHLPKKIVKKMFEELKESNKDGKEHGFSICSNAKNINEINDENTISTESCIGEWCSVSFKRCPKNTNISGDFHTHIISPKKDVQKGRIGTRYYRNFPARSIPSYVDLYSAREEGREYMCLGANDEIKCCPVLVDGKLNEFEMHNIEKIPRIEYIKMQEEVKKIPKERRKERSIKRQELRINIWEKYATYCSMRKDY